MDDNTYLLIEIQDRYIQSAHYTTGGEINLLRKEELNIIYENDSDIGITRGSFEALSTKIEILIKSRCINYKKVRLFACGNFRYLSDNQLAEIKKMMYIKMQVDFNIVTYKQWQEYINESNAKTILYNLVKKEFDTVVICGSYRKHLEAVSNVCSYCEERGIRVLSPGNLKVQDVYQDNFVVFHGEKVNYARETYNLEKVHLDKIDMADVVVICNIDGYIGSTTLLEIGYAISKRKKIVFLSEQEEEFDICFPRSYGLL